MPKIDKDCVRQYEILKIVPKLIKIVFVSYVLFYARTWKIKQPKIAPKIDKDCVCRYEILKIVPKLIKIVFVSYVLFYARTWKIKQPKIALKTDKDCSRLHCMQIFWLKIVNKLLKIENILITLAEDYTQIVDDCDACTKD